ncbi:MAG: hypothetical protein O7D94_05505 [Planctomycetota bacterium]|nr:hypothetical protein [Planctomycetota bacterium]
MVISRRNRWLWGIVCLLGFALRAGPAVGDVLHLKSGGRIECEILEDLGQSYRVRVAIGVVDIKKTDIERHVKGLTSWERYPTLRKKYPDTAKGHYALARWCRKHDLRDKATKHFRRVLQLDPEHEKAHRALGHEKVDDKWQETRKRKRSDQDDADKLAAKQEQEAEALLRTIMSEWHLKVGAIFRSRLNCKTCNPSSDRYVGGRKQILAIRDPLALPAITGVLSRGGVGARRVLVESLAGFAEAEATMNLVVMALVDPSVKIRRLAAEALIPRQDERVTERLRDALFGNDERLLRNAAAALGILKERSVVSDLIYVLSTTRRRNVRVTRPVFWHRVIRDFGGARIITVGTRSLLYRPRGILAQSEAYMTTVDTTESRVVDVYRTEVQEALISITGRNFGFDRNAWMEWWQEQNE